MTTARYNLNWVGRRLTGTPHNYPMTQSEILDLIPASQQARLEADEKTLTCSSPIHFMGAYHMEGADGMVGDYFAPIGDLHDDTPQPPVLYNKFIVLRGDGREVDPDAVYFVLRLDDGDLAARQAFKVYAQAQDDPVYHQQLMDLLAATEPKARG